MHEYEDTAPKWALPLILLSITILLAQILSTTWCSANSEVYGYYPQGTAWQSCVYEMPGNWFFRNATLALSSISGGLLFIDGMRAYNHWKEHKQVNLSRSLMFFSLFSINTLLEILSRAHSRPDYYEGPFTWLFDNFFYLFGTAVLTLAVSLWSIFNKVELIFSISRRNR